MNIIEAFQEAESGKIITNNFLKRQNHCLKYMGSGIFYEYQIEGEYTIYKYEINSFRVSEILSTVWEVIDIKINPKN